VSWKPSRRNVLESAGTACASVTRRLMSSRSGCLRLISRPYGAALGLSAIGASRILDLQPWAARPAGELAVVCHGRRRDVSAGGVERAAHSERFDGLAITGTSVPLISRTGKAEPVCERTHKSMAWMVRPMGQVRATCAARRRALARPPSVDIGRRVLEGLESHVLGCPL
jgi:hypothetical protein